MRLPNQSTSVQRKSGATAWRRGISAQIYHPDGCIPPVFSDPVIMQRRSAGIGQGCYYDCYDEHTGHGDPPSKVHDHCQRMCSISMPAPQQAARYVMYQ